MGLPLVGKVSNPSLGIVERDWNLLAILALQDPKFSLATYSVPFLGHSTHGTWSIGGVFEGPRVPNYQIVCSQGLLAKAG